MGKVQQKLALALAQRRKRGKSAVQSLNAKDHAIPPALFWALACLHALILLLGLPWDLNLPIAILFLHLTVFVMHHVYLFSTRALVALLPAEPEGGMKTVACYCMTPLWIAEVGRLLAVQAQMPSDEWGAIFIFRNILWPRAILSDPRELITVAGAVVTMVRMFLSVRNKAPEISAFKTATTGLQILLFFAVGYALLGLFAFYGLAPWLPMNLMF